MNKSEINDDDIQKRINKYNCFKGLYGFRKLKKNVFLNLFFNIIKELFYSNF